MKVSFDIPDYTTQVNSLGTLRVLEAIRKINSQIKFYQASSSELFGMVQKARKKKLPHFIQGVI